MCLLLANKIRVNFCVKCVVKEDHGDKTHHLFNHAGVLTRDFQIKSLTSGHFIKYLHLSLLMHQRFYYSMCRRGTGDKLKRN